MRKSRDKLVVNDSAAKGILQFEIYATFISFWAPFSPRKNASHTGKESNMKEFDLQMKRRWQHWEK